jgi:hypothetical protein
MFDHALQYNNEDIGYIITTKIEHTVRDLGTRTGKSFDEAYAAFSASRTHELLLDPDTLMWYEPVGYIMNRYLEEINEV